MWCWNLDRRRGSGLTPEDRSDPCERFSRPGSWTRKEPIAREATQAYAGADHPQVARGRAAARRGEDDRGGGEGAGGLRADVSSVAGAVRGVYGGGLGGVEDGASDREPNSRGGVLASSQDAIKNILANDRVDTRF